MVLTTLPTNKFLNFSHELNSLPLAALPALESVVTGQAEMTRKLKTLAVVRRICERKVLQQIKTKLYSYCSLAAAVVSFLNKSFKKMFQQ